MRNLSERELERAALDAGAKRAVKKPLDVIALLDPPAPEERRPPIVHSVRGADLIVDMLEQAGVDVVFGLPGGAISPVHDALLDSRLRVITTRHESGAMFAATAYARSTGKLAVVAVTSGPGMLNSMTGLATAWCDGVAVLLLVGEVPHQVHGKGVLQDGSAHGLQLVEMARNVAKLAVEVPRPSALPHLLRRAIDTAQSGRPGPVVLTLPLDVTSAQINAPRSGGNTTTRETLDPDLINEIGTLVMSAKRPLILAGSGVRADGAPARLLAVAERLGCPVATTPKGKGVFPEDHPLSLGVFGLGGHRSARGYVDAGADVVLVIGTSLGDLATDGFAPQLQAPALIHVDIDARQIGKSYSPTHAVVASAASFLGAFAEQLAERRTPPRAIHGGIIRHVLPSSSKPGWIASHDAVEEIQEVVPANTIYTVDSGEHYLFAVHYLQINHPESFIAMSGLGSMGPSIGAAIGAQLAYPDRFCAALCGDGCFAMNAFEIATAVAENLPIRIFVFNDERLSMVENGHQAVYGRRPSYSTRPLDICEIAQGLGATAMRISRAGELRAQRDTLLHTRGPVVVEVRIDHDIALPKRDRVAAMAPPVVS